MRFIAWNCNERFDRNYLHLRDLDLDVAVVTECGPFALGLGHVREVSSVLKLAVEEPRHTKHIGVFPQDPWHVEPLPLVADQPGLLPVRVTGPVDFTVLAVWALGPDWVEQRLTYARQTARVIAEVLPSLEGPVVLAGDLNAPIASNPSGTRQHAGNVDQLAAHGPLAPSSQLEETLTRSPSRRCTTSGGPSSRSTLTTSLSRGSGQAESS